MSATESVRPRLQQLCALEARLIIFKLSGNGNGLHARSGATFTARNSVFSNNTTNGIFADAAAATGPAIIFVQASQISLNGGSGARAGNIGTPGIEIAQNQIDSNIDAGVVISTNGLVNTFSNNSIQGNAGGDGCAGCTPIGPGN